METNGAMDSLGDLRVGLPKASGTPDGADGSRADPSSSHSESPPAIAGEDGGDATASTASTVAPKLNVSMAAFEVMDEIGEGSFSEVLLVRRRADGANATPVALKVMRKRHILKEKRANSFATSGKPWTCYGTPRLLSCGCCSRSRTTNACTSG